MSEIPTHFDDVQAIALETLWQQMKCPNYPLGEIAAEGYMQTLGAYFVPEGGSDV